MPIRRASRVAAGLLGAVASCVPFSRVELPEVPGAKSALLLVPAIEEGAVGVALDLTLTPESPAGSTPLGLSLDSGAAIYALFFEHALSELELEPGPLHRAREPGRPVPPAEATFVLDREGGAPTWVSLTSAPELTGIELEAVAQRLCVRPGCGRWRAGRSYCESPCTAPDWALEVSPPLAPARPRLTPCPPGWAARSHVGVPGVESCRPPERAQCPEGQVQRPGASECAPLGEPCPSGQWPEPLPAGAVRVWPPATSPCPAEPGTYCTIGEALQRAPPGAPIALAKGRYVEALRVARDVELIGACASETILAEVPGAPILEVTGTASVARVGLTGAQAFEVRRGAELHLREVAISGASQPSLISGELRARSIVIDHSTAGLRLEGAGRAVLAQVLLAGLERAVYAGPGTTLELAEAAIELGRDAGSGPALEPCGGEQLEVAAGAGIVADRAARVRVERSFLRDNASRAIVASETPLELTEVSIERNTGDGLYTCGGTLSIRRGAILGNDRDAVRSSGSELTLEDVVHEGNGGVGLRLLDARGATLSRAYLGDNQEHGALVEGSTPGARIEVLDTELARSGQSSRNDQAAGLIVRGALGVGLTRVRMSRNGNYGLNLVSNGGATLTDVLVNECGYIGLRLACDARYTPDCDVTPPEATLVRVAVVRASVVGALIESSRVTASELVVSDTASGESFQQAGLLVYSANGVPARASLDRFVVASSPHAGISVASDASLELRHGEVSFNPVGVHVVPEDFDLTQLENDVVFRENVVDVELVAGSP